MEQYIRGDRVTSKHRSQSDKEFYAKLWPAWIRPITSAGFSVDSTFVWIDPKQPSNHVEPHLGKTLRSGKKKKSSPLPPQYSVVHIGVELVDKSLGLFTLPKFQTGASSTLT